VICDAGDGVVVGFADEAGVKEAGWIRIFVCCAREIGFRELTLAKTYRHEAWGASHCTDWGLRTLFVPVSKLVIRTCRRKNKRHRVFAESVSGKRGEVR